MVTGLKSEKLMGRFIAGESTVSKQTRPAILSEHVVAGAMSCHIFLSKHLSFFHLRWLDNTYKYAMHGKEN